MTFVLGKGLFQVFIAVGTMWVEVARVIRGQFLVEKNQEYVEAQGIASAPPTSCLKKFCNTIAHSSDLCDEFRKCAPY